MRYDVPAAAAATALLLAAAAAPTASAQVLQPTAIGTVDPPGGQVVNPSDVTDDLLLGSLAFGSVLFTDAASFSPALAFEVLSQRANINAEWGDDDDAGDGDDNPFVKAGFDPADQETTDPAIQDAALLQAFNSNSLSEMADGESGGYAFKMLFANGLSDDQPGVADGTPELIFFERGMNDAFRVELIIGGDFDAPIYSDPVEVATADFWDTGLDIDTTEITSPQALGAGGLDFDDFGLALDAVVYGMRLTVTSGGPDLNGFFLSTVDPARFVDPLPLHGAPKVPLPPAAATLLAAAAALAALRRARPRA
jgi:hypothetical protein